MSTIMNRTFDSGSLLLLVGVVGVLPHSLDLIVEPSVDRCPLGRQSWYRDGLGGHSRRVIEVGRPGCRPQIEVVLGNSATGCPRENYISGAEHGAGRRRGQYRIRDRRFGVSVIGMTPY